MRLLQLRYFSMVAKTENVSQAARILHTSQPSLSRALNELENELGIKLFVRNGHSLKLNENGLIFKNYIDSALNLIDNSTNEIKRISEAHKNQVVLGFETSSPLIPGIIHYLKSEIPDINISLIQNGLENDDLIHYDFEFSTHKINGNINDLLMTEEIMVAVNQDNSLDRKKSIDIDSIQNHPVILTTPSPLRTTIESFFQNHNIFLNPSFITGDRYTIKGLISEDIGISFIPVSSWFGNMNSEKIKFLHLSPDKLKRNIYLSYPTGNEKNEFFKRVMNLIKDYFKSHVEKAK